MYNNKSCTHQQHFIIKPTTTGTWELRYTTPESKRWSCWLIYDPVATIASTSSISSVTNQTLTNIDTGEKITADLYKTSKKMYAVPSKNFKNKKTKTFNKTNPLNIDQLVVETFDENNGRFINMLKNFSIGDTLIFKDSIEDIIYDKENNATKFTFKFNTDDTIDWYFKGDLTENYKKGDTLNLKFKIVEEYSDENFTFETLDYIKNSSNAYQDINNYLLN